VERKEEAGHARRHRRDQKPFRPTVEAFTAEHAEQDNQAGKNPEKADNHVNDCVEVQYQLFFLALDERE
jgi:hypothetical protein